MDFAQFLNLLVHFDQQLGRLIAHHHEVIYVMLFVVVFCEIGVLPLFFLPGDPLLLDDEGDGRRQGPQGHQG